MAAKQYGSITSATSSPDGRRILYSHNDIDEDHKIWSVNQWGQDAYVIADGVGQVYGLAWSPDEKKIIFQGNGWMIMNSNGSNIQPIKAGDFFAGVYSAAQWSPDSHYIMVSSMRRNTDQVAEDSNTVREAVYLIDAENLTVSPLLPDRYIYDPSWSPDGSYIIYATFDDGVYEVRITNVQGTYEQSIAKGSTLIRHPMWINS